MSQACEPAPQPSATNSERAHPRYREWANYKHACAAQLVTATPFSTWLRSVEEFENGKETVFRTQPGAMIADGWYKHIFLPSRHQPVRLGPFATKAEAEAATRG